ncbi:MAG: MoaD/ThiS family protein [Burkholderiales bacterium]|nr:MoaD/ThiS family protein [Flavobacterium sp.]
MMDILTVKYFGILADIAQKNEEQFPLDITDSSLKRLQSKLEICYPEMKNIPYVIAVNQSIVNTKEKLKHNDELALLPPFSGG